MSENRQRWRLIFARGDEARYLSHLDAVHTWERAFRRGEIPVSTSEGFSPRPRLVFAAPLQLGMLAEHELADIYLAEKLTAPGLRDRLVAALPNGYRVVDLFDVWVNSPAIAPQLAAADYRLTLLNVERDRLAGAVERLMATDQLLRERRKEARTIRYDLRPLILDLRVGEADRAAVPSDVTEAAGLWMRLRHSQSGGSGRAEEVVAALADDLGLAAKVAFGDTEEGETRATAAAEESAAPEAGAGTPRLLLDVVRPVRERLWLGEELNP